MTTNKLDSIYNTIPGVTIPLPPLDDDTPPPTDDDFRGGGDGDGCDGNCKCYGAGLSKGWHDAYFFLFPDDSEDDFKTAFGEFLDTLDGDDDEES